MFGNRAIQYIVSIVFLIAIVVLPLWRGTPTPNPPRTDVSATSARPTVAPPHDSADEQRSINEVADFDYYVLVLSWSPTHCASDRGRGADDDLQCRSGRPFGFVLHGLWPQYERGYPKDCPSEEPRDVDAQVLDEIMKLSPSEDLVTHEWEKHGTCSGLNQRDYFASAERAFNSIAIPSAYERPPQALRTTPDDVRDAFLKANPKLPSDALSATCSRNEFAELWVCLDKTLVPRACSAEVAKRHCGAREVRMRAVRGDWPK